MFYKVLQQIIVEEIELLPGMIVDCSKYRYGKHLVSAGVFEEILNEIPINIDFQLTHKANRS